MGRTQKIVVFLIMLTVLVGSAVQVVPAYRKMKNAEREVAEKAERLARVKADLHSLQQEIHDLEHKRSAIEKVAREKFKYCREGERIFLYTE